MENRINECASTLLRLPVHLRRRICEHAIDTRAVFYFSSPDDDEYLQAKLLEGICFPSADCDTLSFREPLLGYKLSSFTPLLLVCKQVSREVQGIIKHRNAVSHALITESIEYAQFVEPFDPEFLDLCARSRLDIGLESEEAMPFLEKMPKPIRQRIQSLVITASNLYCDDWGNRKAWSMKDINKKSTPYTDLLRRKFPGLQEIAVFVPGSSGEEDWYADSAPLAIGGMLQDGLVKVVRFLYRQSDPSILDYCTRIERAQSGIWLAADNLVENRLIATIEELLDAKTGKPLKQTCESPFNRWPEANTVVALRKREP